MSPGASFYGLQPDQRHGPGGVGSALAIAILFAVIAATSFAVDQNVTLSSLPAPPTADNPAR